MGNSVRRSRRRLVLLSSIACLAFAGAVGCRTTEQDIHRWGETLNGPKRLEAVITHDKYSLDLRTEAAMTLVRMRPRNGRRIGIEGGDDPEQQGVLAALGAVNKETRSRIITKMVPALLAGMRSPPADKEHPVDNSYPYKDAAFALLTHDNGALISSDENRHNLQQGLVDWVVGDFAGRMDETSQIYSMDQVLGYLRAPGVRRLPDLMAPGTPKLDRMADFVADFGDDATRDRASAKLVEIAKFVSSQKWLDQRAPQLKRANEESKLNPTPKQFQEQLLQYQEEELLRLFTSMKRVGRKPVVEYLTAYAASKDNDAKRRTAALAALEGNIDKNDSRQIDALFALVDSPESPDTVRDLALRRLSELPRKMVIGRLYGLFASKDWKVRWVTGELVLKMSDTTQVGEFMDKIGTVKEMAMAEPLRYGELIGQMKGPESPASIAKRYAKPNHRAPTRLTALGWYYHSGTSADLAGLRGYAEDRMRTPKCPEEAKDCEWKCDIHVDGKTESKEISSVGDFVSFCVIPEIERRTSAGASKK